MNKTSIVTYTGKVIDLSAPNPKKMCIADIAHSLALQCRYGGHCKVFYSVAEHSVRMAREKSFGGDPISRLMHDSAEAYMGDICQPLKVHLWTEYSFLERISRLEARLLEAIEKGLGIRIQIGSQVKTADGIMYRTEVRDLTDVSEAARKEYVEWCKILQPLRDKIVPWSAEVAEEEFLRTFQELTK